MVRCPDCETSNSTDSKFCKFCGAALPEEELIDAQLKLNELLSEGYRIFNEGRTEEARLIAESALESAPNTTQALTLKAMCCEREGELADALELYEKVVELNPESSLDKIKVTHLRNQLNAKQIEAPAPNKKLALVVAAAAVVLVVCVGGIIAALTADKAEATEKQPVVAQNNDNNAAFDKTGSVPPPKQEPELDGDGSVNRSNGQPGGGIITPPTPIKDPLMPNPNPDGGWGPITLNPDNKETIANTRPNPTNQNTGLTGGTGPATDDKGDPPVEPEKQPEEKKPIVEVSFSSRGPKNHGGSDDSSNSNELTVLIKSANEQFMLSRYQNAARSYEKALSVGADPASTNQRLGQCYSNLGRKSEAIGAYVRAADAYKAAVARGNSPSARAGLSACNNALKVLRGE